MLSHPEKAATVIGAATFTTEHDLVASAERGGVPSVTEAAPPAMCGSRTFWRLTSAVVLLTVAYVAYERVGTIANADRITHLQSFGDEAVAIGLTDDQPGFVLLARLPASQMSVEAAMRSNWLTGQQTHVRIHTPAGTTNIRLRRPQAIMVHEDGTVIKVPVPWTLAEFGQLLHAADCASECREHLHRCGQPLEDIAHTLATWPEERVPGLLREFVKKRRPGTAQVDASTRESDNE